MRETRLGGHISESAIVVIAIQLAGMALARAQILEGRTIDQKYVHPAIVVVVEDGDPAAHCLHDVTLVQASAGEMKVDSGGAGDIHELRGFGRGRR